MKITEKEFGQGAILYSLTNNQGMSLEVTNFGARIVNLVVPTKKGAKNIVLGFDSAEEYFQKDLYIGATIGRVAGRITGGTFAIDGETYEVAVDPENGNTLHGGPDSFEEKFWQAKTEISEEQASVIFSYESPAGENGFPGNLAVKVVYSLNNQNEWSVVYQATTDQPTLFNPTNHVYFNLTGDVEQSVAKHSMVLDANQFMVVSKDTTVTGELRSVEGTPFDFRTSQLVEQVFETNYEQNTLVKGLDHPFRLNPPTGSQPQGILCSPEKDIIVEMYTDQPAVVIFTAQFGENAPIVHGKQLVNHGGITLETQVSPGAIEFEGFGNIILRPEVAYQSQTVYKILI